MTYVLPSVIVQPLVEPSVMFTTAASTRLLVIMTADIATTAKFKTRFIKLFVPFSRRLLRGTYARLSSTSFPSGFRPIQTSAGRKTKTSSDASQEAPERARKDTPKEVNCISRAASLLCVFTSVVSQAFLRRVPCPQGLGYCSSPPCAGNLFYHGGIGIHPCSATVSYYTTKSGLRRKTQHVRIRRRRPIRALSAGRSL